MKVTVIPVVIDTLGTVTKELIQGLEDLEIRGQMESIQPTALLRSARILRRVLENEETCCHEDSTEKQSADTGVKIFQKSKNINNNLLKNRLVGCLGFMAYQPL